MRTTICDSCGPKNVKCHVFNTAAYKESTRFIWRFKLNSLVLFSYAELFCKNELQCVFVPYLCTVTNMKELKKKEKIPTDKLCVHGFFF